MQTAHCGTATVYSAIWTGLDGYSSDSLEQVGADDDCVSGSPDYYGWYELYPAPPVYFSNAVRPGDRMSASVTFSGTKTFTIVLADSTAGWTQTVTKSLAGVARSSAETILELPEGLTCTTPSTLVTFTKVMVDGKEIGGLSPVKVTGSDPSIVVSPITGSSFSVSCT